MARIIGIDQAETTASTTVYDPTCGSGSLLLKVSDAAKTPVTLYGQEKDAATSGLARMNMILHNNPGAEIKQGNTLANPLFLYEQGGLKTFDYVVANPPFSDKRWGNGVDTVNDPFQRFDGLGVPPDKNGDYAYLLHIIRSLKSRGKGACILPHGVLFRGNVEAAIRTAIIRKGLIKGIIGLPANLFYGTGIPTCIIVLDKENAQNRKGIFMIDAGKGFMKDGNKNRLREMDFHRIVDVFNKQIEIAGYSKIVSFSEIEKNEFNLNIPRYIDSSETEDLQDIEAHLLGDIPRADIDALHDYWAVCPNLKAALFTEAKRSPNYLSLKVSKDAIKPTIYAHPEFVGYMADMNRVFCQWENNTTAALKALQPGFHPKDIIHSISEALLATYEGRALIDRYDVYQHLMNYWFDVMQDDCYLIAADGWQAATYRIVEEKKTKDGQVTKTVDKGWTCDLIPKALVIHRYFAAQQQAIDALNTELETLQSRLLEMAEEHGGEEGVFAELDKINKASINTRLKEIKNDPEAIEEEKILKQYLELLEQEAATKKAIHAAEMALDVSLLSFYPTLTADQIKQLVVDDKWIAAIDKDIHTEMDRISQRLTQRIKELAERYETPLPQQNQQVEELEQAVNAHLRKMGFAWN